MTEMRIFSGIEEGWNDKSQEYHGISWIFISTRSFSIKPDMTDQRSDEAKASFNDEIGEKDNFRTGSTWFFSTLPGKRKRPGLHGDGEREAGERNQRHRCASALLSHAKLLKNTGVKMSETPELWKATYEAKTPGDLAEAYRDWVDKYDEDTRDVMGYIAPDLAATMLDRRLDTRSCRILDAGCGTGLVGEVLKDMGYDQVEAMDYSSEMLGKAKEKGVYSHCFRADMNENLSLPDNVYDAVICVGTFTYAHVGPDAFEELARVTKPGGYVCFTIRDGAYQDYEYRRKMLELEAEKKWRLMEMRQEDYLVKESVEARFCTYEVLGA